MVIRLFEFAEQRKEIERDLKARTVKIIEHLLYLVLDKNNSARNHWKQEIVSFLSDIDIQKGNKKLPKKKFIYDATYGKRQDRVTDDTWITISVRNACRKENFKNTKDSMTIKEELDTLCIAYFTWLAENLSTVGIIDSEEAYDKIDELLKNVT